MDDRFMNGLREEPRPEFGRSLRTRLRALEAPDTRPHWVPALAIGGAVAAMVLAFMLPSVRASAQAFLDLFRVRNFAAVPVDRDRIRMLEDQKIDLESLLGDRVETLKEPGEPRVYGSADEAGAAAGIDVREPTALPQGITLQKVEVRGDGAARVTIDTARLRSLLETLNLRDVEIPPGLDGRTVEVRVPPVVIQSYRRGEKGPAAELMQAKSPEVTLPQGVDLARLGEIGLRIVGLSADEARRFASTIDWSSTLLVPVPAGAGSFREVEVQGQRGLMVTIEEMKRPDGTRRGRQTVVLWSQADRVYGLCGNLEGVNLLAMANSLQ